MTFIITVVSTVMAVGAECFIVPLASRAALLEPPAIALLAGGAAACPPSGRRRVHGCWSRRASRPRNSSAFWKPTTRMPSISRPCRSKKMIPGGP
ncbi:MAG: hypothetical protein AW08_02563 [Candidatus Accumulibacter adjunctus]|uniref:Uncharacterized protein n=1 Tax=Candidatus Accumulibacter adjunctus TaxID=1454001 RepID=A0A011PJM6_9PROT|nr:MAG: hypothetical protein AW08_02563 [Candidatus Accumulibacter adjunctus]